MFFIDTWLIHSGLRAKNRTEQNPNYSSVFFFFGVNIFRTACFFILGGEEGPTYSSGGMEGPASLA
jgi:hypothetical protein